MEIRIIIKKNEKPEEPITLKQFIKIGEALNKLYGNDSYELAVAIGRLFDNHCCR